MVSGMLRQPSIRVPFRDTQESAFAARQCEVRGEVTILKDGRHMATRVRIAVSSTGRFTHFMSFSQLCPFGASFFLSPAEVGSAGLVRQRCFCPVHDDSAGAFRSPVFVYQGTRIAPSGGIPFSR